MKAGAAGLTGRADPRPGGVTLGNTGALIQVEVSDHTAMLRVEPEGWVVGTVGVNGDLDALLARQGAIHHLAKVVAGPALRADWPILGSLYEAVILVREGLEAGLAAIAGGAPESAPGDPIEPETVRAAIEASASASAWGSSREGAMWRFEVETPHGRQRIVAESVAGGARLVSELARAGTCPPVSQRALAHFLVALNGRLRLARGWLEGGRAGLEVILPARVLGPDLVDRAIAALITGFGVARRECAALLEPAVAEAYEVFHTQNPALHVKQSH